MIQGANTARAAAFKNGRISTAQIEILADKFCKAGRRLFKVLVTHHPFLPPLDDPHAALVGRGALAVEAFEPCGIDLLLAGHYHRGYMGDLQGHYVAAKRSIIVSQAGTATSKRTGARGTLMTGSPSIRLTFVSIDMRGRAAGLR